ncbi:hypothetical protein AaE_015128 [Aphanomyces astaci]|uniref:DDE Tnp4 domain-containing protein n=1 Tax=Aphanomyces astaci TaxID=112090 RepID=A0A6A4Z2N9_APHAT|nr:hypothetical protein AaE_015128 [Aphanomyces astaci]
MWYSHKFHGPGLRYEIGLCIRTGQIVWVNGGVPCGAWPDLTLARSGFVRALLPNEQALADRGYSGEAKFITPNTQVRTSQRQKQIMSRHETVNARLKQFGALQQKFRHELHLHPLCFYAVANIVQMTIENGSLLFSV